MGGVKPPDKSSLDRLKVLDSIPEFASQLDEARQLCNHSARAEMILRWLLGQWKVSKDAQFDDASWDLLAVCARLLPPQRLANLLAGSSGFIDMLQRACTEVELGVDTVLAISRLWSLLHELGQGASGAPILAFLSTNSASAAAICGGWLRQMHDLCSRNDHLKQMIVPTSLLDVSLQVWTARRRQAVDDDLFNQCCLLPATRMLSLLSSMDITPSRKRRQGQSITEVELNYVHALETLVSRHAILPARTEFLKTRATEPQHSLSHFQILDADALPLVFDLLLRSVAISNPRQRLKERPWVDMSLTELCHTIASSSLGRKSLSRVIQCVRHRGASVSKQVLATIFKQYARPDLDSQTSWDWELVSAIVELDSSLLPTDGAVADEVFDAVTLYSAEAPPQLLYNVSALTVEGYAQARNLNGFIDRWFKQLLNVDGSSIWTKLVPVVSEQVRASFTQDQILSALDHHTPAFTDVKTLDHTSATESINALRASFVVLRALLHGMHSEDSTKSMRSRIDILRVNLLGLKISKEDDIPYYFLCDLWDLLTSVLEEYFQEQEYACTDARDLAHSVVTSEVVILAKIHCKTATPSTSTAQMLIGCLCNHLCISTLSDEAEHLLNSYLDILVVQASTCVPVLLKYPALVGHLQDDVCELIFRTDIGSDAVPSRDMNLAARSLPAKLQSALVKNTIESEHPDKALVQLLGHIDIASLEQRHRAQALDVLAQVAKLPLDATELRQRLVMMEALLAYPCSGARLVSDPASVWNIAKLFAGPSTKENSQASVSSFLRAVENLSLLRAIVRFVLSANINAGNPHQSKIFLEATSKQIKKEIKVVGQSTKESAECLQATVTIVSTAVEGLESIVNKYGADQLAYREGKTIGRFLGSVLDLLERHADALEKAEHGLDSAALICSLEALILIPMSVLDTLGSDKGSTCRRIKSVVESMLRHRTINDNSGSMTSQSVVLKKASLVISKYGQISLNDPSGNALHDHALTARGRDADAKVAENSLGTIAAESEEVMIDQSPSLPQSDPQGETTGAFGKDPTDLLGHDSLQHALHVAYNGSSVHVKRTALGTVASVIKEKSCMVNQHDVEQCLYVVQRILARLTDAPAVFETICQIISTLLAQYRARLQGRYHLMSNVFQECIRALFRGSSALNGTNAPVLHARALAKLLQTFCDPPYARSRGATSQLIDEARKAKSYAGEHARHILHAYCAEILVTTPAEGIRETLWPSIEKVIEAILTHKENGIQSLSSTMNNGEREVLRSIHADWKHLSESQRS